MNPNSEFLDWKLRNSIRKYQLYTLIVFMFANAEIDEWTKQSVDNRAMNGMTILLIHAKLTELTLDYKDKTVFH